MKRIKNNLFSIIIVAGMVALTACEGPMGEAGNDTCKECHSLENRNMKSAEYETSGHAAGLFVGYAGGRNSCAQCHSHEGFVETEHTGRDTTAANIPIPTRIDCKTCHDSHTSFKNEVDGPDYALRGLHEVNLLMFGNEQKLDFESNSNLCANCHQPRTLGPVGDAEGNFRITSSHYGPHHGPQATYVQGIGAYEFAGSESYPTAGTSTHATGGACVACHMGEADQMGGGHSFTANVAACTSCHSDASTLDINGIQTEVHELLVDLKGLLTTKGILDDEGHVKPGTYSVELAGAFYNYIGIEEDRSLGVHNPSYIKAVLKNTIAAMN